MNVQAKSSRFINLLPQIYQKLIMERLGHTLTALWLLQEHDLNFFPVDKETKKPLTDQYPNLFYLYLNRYGNYKKAKEDYEQQVGGLNDNWWEQLDNYAKPHAANSKRQQNFEPSQIQKQQSQERVEKPVVTELNLGETKPFNQDEMLKNLTFGSNNDATPSLAEKLNLEQKKQDVITNPLEGYKPKRFTH